MCSVAIISIGKRVAKTVGSCSWWHNRQIQFSTVATLYIRLIVVSVWMYESGSRICNLRIISLHFLMRRVARMKSIAIQIRQNLIAISFYKLLLTLRIRRLSIPLCLKHLLIAAIFLSCRWSESWLHLGFTIGSRCWRVQNSCATVAQRFRLNQAVVILPILILSVGVLIYYLNQGQIASKSGSWRFNYAAVVIMVV